MKSMSDQLNSFLKSFSLRLNKILNNIDVKLKLNDDLKLANREATTTNLPTENLIYSYFLQWYLKLHEKSSKLNEISVTFMTQKDLSLKNL